MLDTGILSTVREVAPHAERRLRARPHRQLAVRAPERAGAVRLDVALVRPRDGVRPLQYVSCLCERRVGVAEFGTSVLGDVRVRNFLAKMIAHEVVVDDHCVRGHGVFEADHRLEWLVFNLDELERFERGVLVDSGHRRHGMPLEDDLVVGHDALARPLGVGDLLSEVYHFRGRDRHIGAAYGCEHARRCLRLRDVNLLDDGMRVGAAEHRSVDQPGHLNVRAVLSAPQHLVHAVVTDGASADHLKILLGTVDRRCHLMLLCGQAALRHLFGGPFDRAHDFVIPGATAEVARKP